MFFKGVLSPGKAGGEDAKFIIFLAFFMARDSAVARSLLFLQQGHVALTASWRLLNMILANVSAVDCGKWQACMHTFMDKHAHICMCVASMHTYMYVRGKHAHICMCVASMQHAPCMCVASMWNYAYPRCVQLAALATLHLASSESGTTSAAQGRNFHK